MKLNWKNDRAQVAIMFSIATFFYFPMWRRFFVHSGTFLDSIFIPIAFQNNIHDINLYYFAAVISILGMFSIFLILYYVFESNQKQAGTGFIVFLFWCLIIHALIYVLTRGPFIEFFFSSSLATFSLMILVFIGAGISYLYKRALKKILSVIFIISSPVAGVIVANLFLGGVVLTYKTDWWQNEKPLFQNLKKENTVGKTVFLLFDEWDYQTTFERRHIELETPELDKLRRESFFATAAQEAGIGTHTSVGTMTTGKLMDRYKIERKDSMALRLLGTDNYKSWNEFRTIFSDTKLKKMNIGLVSQGLKYCRHFHYLVTKCWEDNRSWREQNNLMTAIGQFFFSFIAHVPLIGNKLEQFLFFHANVDYQKEIERSLLASHKMLKDLESDFIYIHLMVPHAPFFYISKDDSFTKVDQGYSAYHENLAFLDKIIGEMRRSMESAGIWNVSTIVLTSDHHLRILKTSDVRVPFIVKLPRQTQGFEYKKQFNVGRVVRKLIDESTSFRLKEVSDVIRVVEGNW